MMSFFLPASARAFSLLLLLLCAILAGCAGTPPLLDSSGKPIPVPAAGFRLQAADVKWQPHADYQVRGVVKARDQKALDIFVPKVSADMEKRYVLLKASPPDVMAALARKGVVKGDAQTIELRPLYGYFEQAGSGSGIVLQVTVVDAATRQSWVHRVKADTGMQVINPLVGPAPGDDYVAGFVRGLMEVFREAGLIR